MDTIASRTTASPIATTPSDARNRRLNLHPPSLARLLEQSAVEVLFREVDALELQQLRVLLNSPVEWERHLPRPGEDLGILDGGFVHQVVGRHRRVALDDVKRVAVIV